ncbi:MAG TPA: glycosyltransferase family 4 protein [Candidatus Cybelea sp.]|nr:glycosyltransferase family 4 protein [Candidatus Cybelea sp.]
MTRLPKVLFVCHNHPDLHPGGTEIFSHALFRELRRAHGLDALYLACAGRVHRTRSPGTMLQAVGRAADEMLLWCGHFETFNLSQTDLHGVMIEFERLLAEVRPDVVHFHHVLLIGVEALQVVRRVLPKAAIVLTLHDYYAICANDGQMVTTGDRRLCRLASPDACARCFPDWGRDRFVMRELFVKQALTLVDRFVSPSAFLKQRYVDWGLPDDRIDIVRNGIAGPAPAPHRALPDGGRRNRFAFFGHLNPFKGAMVAIEAARRLAERDAGPFSLTLHGSAEFQSDEFKAAIAKALEGAAMVESRGRYGREEIPALMADTDWVIVPSIWWENAPLVIQEAFHHRRPVICSNIGGMAEAVLDGVDGLWFRAGDAAHLSERMEQGLDQALWTQLANNIAPPRSIAAAAADHLALFERVLAEPRRVEWPQPSEQAVRRRRRKTSTEPEQAGAAQ